MIPAAFLSQLFLATESTEEEYDNIRFNNITHCGISYTQIQLDPGSGVAYFYQGPALVKKLAIGISLLPITTRKETSEELN